MKRNKKSRFLEELGKIPIVQVACDKMGISRQTYYRWRKEDIHFKEQADEALGYGVDFINDIAESNVVMGVRNKDPGYTKYWLSARHPAYQRPLIRITKSGKVVKADVDAMVAMVRRFAAVRKENEKGEKGDSSPI